MTIYHSTKKMPYVYRCTEKETDKFYIGYRYKNYLPSTQDLGHKYFTSNDYVKNNFEKFDVEIIAEFFHKKDAYKFESELIRETKSDLQINSFRYRKVS